jgi:hypothetical protein
MTDDHDNLARYFDRLTDADRAQLEERLARYGPQLEEEGYEVTIAEGQNAFFAGVLVIDDAGGRFGFLEADGSVSWIAGSLGGIGALGSAVVQSPSDELEGTFDGHENVDVE